MADMANWVHDRPSVRRAALWVAIGVAALCMVIMRDVNMLVASLGISGQTYDTSVFTGVNLDPTNVSDLAAAINAWNEAANGVDVRSWLFLHLLADAFFVPAFSVIVGYVVWRVGGRWRTAVVLAGSYALLDWIETTITYVVLIGGDLANTNAWALRTIHMLSLAKWLWLTVVVIAIVLLWADGARGTTSFSRMAKAIEQNRQGHQQHPATALSSLVVIVAIFVLLVAVPAGGPLEQIPDVLRYQLSGAPGWVFARSTLAFLGLIAAIITAGLLATTSPASNVAGSLGTRRVLGGAACVSVVAFGVDWIIDGQPSVVPLSWVIVVVTLTVAAFLRRVIDPPDAMPDPGPAPGNARAHTPHTPQSTPDEPAVAEGSHVPDDANEPGRDHQAMLWVGALAGVVVLAGGIGLVRAGLLPWLLRSDDRAIWAVATVGGAVAVIVGSAVVQHAVPWIGKWNATLRRVVGLAIAVVLSIAAGWLAIAPDQAHSIGTTGTIDVGFAAIVLLAGGLMWLSRTRPRWPVTQQLGFGMRTPWLTLLVVVWLAAGALDVAGGYHDARLHPTSGAPSMRYRTVSTAFTTWIAAQKGCSTGNKPIPLVFVAAPGGGIRAAYWTATALDRLTGRDPASCAARRIFAVSGVSGGSVGAATWVSAAAEDASATAAVRGMSGEQALAAGAAALLTRDLLQPLTGVSHGWADRAAHIEAAWQETGGVFETDDGAPDQTTRTPTSWSRIGEGLRWVPVLVLNAASVTDGCRILVTNTGGLPATGTGDCQRAPTGGSPLEGPVSAATDLRWLGTSTPSADDAEDDRCMGSGRDVQTTTAALLSARFPYLTPTGALRGCVDGKERVTYAVDGGYYDNTGLLTILQLHAATAPHVAAYNATRRGPRIQTWIVVVDNHYRTDASAGPSARPRELFAPLQALLARGRTLADAAMEQQATTAVSCLTRDDPGCPAGGRDVRFARIAPRRSPTVSAPLGWVLSKVTRDNLDGQLARQLQEGTDGVGELRAQLAHQDPDRPDERS